MTVGDSGLSQNNSGGLAAAGFNQRDIGNTEGTTFGGIGWGYTA